MCADAPVPHLIEKMIRIGVGTGDAVFSPAVFFHNSVDMMLEKEFVDTTNDHDTMPLDE